MALAADWITIPSRTRQSLRIEYEQNLSILQLKPIKRHIRKVFKAEGGKVDMLSLIPQTSHNGYRMYVDEDEMAGEPWLRIWYFHPRGAARQTELKRYVDVTKLGQLLGQLQAEGDKNNPRIVFKNSSVSEHSDFVSSLHELGLSSKDIHGRCVFNPLKVSDIDAENYSEAYRRATGIPITSIDEMPKMKGAIAADTSVRSAILARTLVFAMNEVRRGSFENEALRKNFLAKLLSGDGTLDVRKTPKRLDVRLTVTDQNISSLQDYAKILSREGFKPKVLMQRIIVRAYCTWPNLLRLYEIGAFRNGRNWIKLLCSIMIAIRGAQNRGYRRIQELITSQDLCTKYGIGRRASNLWINSMRKVGLIEKLPQAENLMRHSYAVTSKGLEISRLIEAIDGDYNEIALEKGVEDPEEILERNKKKSRLRLAEQGPEAR